MDITPKNKGCRIPNKCTGCGKTLPDSKLGWGLVWGDGSGFCAKCLYHIRKAIGYFERTNRTLAPKKRLSLKEQREQATQREQAAQKETNHVDTNDQNE